MTYLFLFTLGPVQSFIAQARKTRDLNAGSQLLSKLVRTGMDSFRENGGECIFPNGESQTQPNRFLGYLESGDSSALQSIGKAVEDAVREEWTKIAKTALGKLTKPDGYDEQVAQAIELFWVFQPATVDGYATAYRNIERGLGAIKNARPVVQYFYQEDKDQKVLHGERGRKCSLDGERNVKFYRLGETRTGEKERENTIYTKLFVSNRSELTLVNGDGIDMKVIAAGEGLSAVSWVKRNYASEDFESTAYFAAADFVNKVGKIDLLKDQLNFIKSCYGGNSWDEQLLFEENYTEKYFKQQGTISHFRDEGVALENIREFYKACRENGIDKPNGYYALLLFDGDDMGQWLSGTNLVQGTDGKTLFDFHQKLAHCLADYSKAGKEYLSAPLGKAVYSGGDDFLGFVTLDQVFPVLKELRRLFDYYINKPLFEGTSPFQTKNGKRMTFSAGLVLAHYKTPLHVVLDWARATEKSAKKYIHPDGQRKDMLGLSVLKASGEINQAFVPFSIAGSSATDRLGKITESLRDNFSDKWMRNLAQEFALLTDHKSGILELPNQNGQANRELLMAEVGRLLTRACQKQGKEKEKKVGKLLLEIEALLPRNAAEGFGNFTALLHICDFIERHTQANKSISENTKASNHA